MALMLVGAEQPEYGYAIVTLSAPNLRADGMYADQARSLVCS